MKNLPPKTEIKINYIRTYNPKEYDLMPLNSINIMILEQERDPQLIPIIKTSHGSAIVYRGAENLLTFEVVGAESYKVTAPGLRLEFPEEHIYIIDVNSVTDDQIWFDFEITTDEGSVVSGKDFLYIRDITPKKVTINDKSCKDCILKLKRSELKNAKLDVRIDSPEEPWANVNVYGFNITVSDGRVSEYEGDIITKEIFSKIEGLPDRSIIEVKVNYLFAGATRDPRPLKIMILD